MYNLNNYKSILLIVVIVLITSFIGVNLFSDKNRTSQNDDLLSTVLDKGEIRAGYVVDPPAMIKDPNTGELSGIFHDALEVAGENLDLKINWVEEAGWGTMIEGLDAGRYDVIVTDLWPNAARAKNIDFTIPLYYSAVGVYTRPDENRFADLVDINNPDITVATIDGEMSAFITQSNFPDATVISLPQDTPVSQLLLNVITHKADVTFVQPAIAEEFLANNPGSVKNITKDDPIRSFGNTMGIPKNQAGFESMMNTALEELLNNGKINELIHQYEKYPGSFYPVVKPYTVP
ncbi:MAG: transporter substrate-binding domain-containing protein [Patescibacteria group bacterium]|jgi:ABC-type amino acid transport substrate-binding protein